MEFYEFAQRIGSVILKDGNISAFTKTLIEAIVPVNVSNDLLTSTNVEIYKAYYYGRIRITRIAKKVYSVGNPRLFELFLWRQNKNESLCEAFSDVIDDITPDNACEYIADEFFLILYDAIKPATYVSRRRGGGGKTNWHKRVVKIFRRYAAYSQKLDLSEATSLYKGWKKLQIQHVRNSQVGGKKQMTL